MPHTRLILRSFVAHLPLRLCTLVVGLTVLLLALPSRANISEEIERQVQADPRAALAAAQAGLTRAHAAQDRHLELRMLRLLVLARESEAVDLTQQIEGGLALARSLGDVEAEIDLLIALAGQGAEGDTARAESVYKQAERLAEQTNRKRQLVRAQLSRATVYDISGKKSEALALFAGAAQTAEAQGDHFGAALAFNGMARAGVSRRSNVAERKRSIELYRNALALIDRDAHAAFAIDLMHNLGWSLAKLGDLPGARAMYMDALPRARRLASEAEVALLQYRLASVELAEGHPAEALALLDLAEPALEKEGGPGMQFNVRLERADALARLGEREASLRSLASAQQLLAALKSATRDAAYFDTAAQVHSRLGDKGQAYELMRRLRDAEKAAAATANDELSAELRTRFDSERKEKDNEILRARERESDARRWVLVLALVCAVLLLCGLAVILRLQVRQKRRFADLALRDELTRLPNRRSVLETAERQWRGRRNVDTSFYLALLDIDHFKQVNDRHGHDVGDAVLRAFAQTCGPLIRASDTLGRFGGEEFLLVLPHCDAASLAVVFERLQKAVHGIRVPNVDFGRELSFSMGAAAAMPDESLEALIKRVDTALYAAKHAGRDRCSLAPASVSEARVLHPAAPPATVEPALATH